MEITIANHVEEIKYETTCGDVKASKINGVKSITIYFEPGETDSQPAASKLVADICMTVFAIYNKP